MLKDFCFRVKAEPATRRLVTVTSDDKPKIAVATAAEFRDGIAGVWSPEALLVAATATSYALTLSAILRRRSIPVEDLAVTGVGHVTRRADGAFGFVVIELAVELWTQDAFERQLRSACAAAQPACIAAAALGVPVEVELKVHTKPVAVTA